MRIALLLSALLLTVGCEFPTEIATPTQTVTARVRSMTAKPEHTDLQMIPIYGGKNGPMWTFVPVYKPAQYTITFVWSNNTWIVDVSKEVYDRLDAGRNVRLQFRNVNNAWRDGRTEFARRDFINAYPEDLTPEQP